jgi:bis(5'-nucleosyl)-tetraphosphatase (symmetrical)
MPTYAIGDVHGCYEQLQALLERIEYDPESDRLWLVGDLVNRGPQSVEVLRWAAGQGKRVRAVLGNHDLHLLALARGAIKRRGRRRLDQVLEAPDGPKLIKWLSKRPLLYREGDWVMVHAGLMPSWSLKRAERLAREVEKALRSRKGKKLLARYYKRPRARWRKSMTDLERLRVALAAFTLLRTCKPNGTLCLRHSGPLWAAPRGAKAWFLHDHKRKKRATVLFGHWAALGLHAGPGVYGLDTGCVWRGRLTALRLEDGEVFDVPGLS